MTISLDKICRTCMIESLAMIPIWSKGQNSQISSSIEMMLSPFSTIKPKIDDGLPSQICLTCVGEINQAFSFKQKCERSEAMLRSLLPEMISLKVKQKEENASEILGDVTNEFQITLDELAEETHLNEELEERDGTIQFIVEQHCEEVGMELTSEEICSTEENTTDNVINDVSKEISNKTQYYCDHCNAPFVHSKSLKLHLNSKKCFDENVQCEICSKVFVRKCYLLKHMNTEHNSKTEKKVETQHDEKKKYKCDICDKNFRMISTLKDHLRVHSKEKPFLCSICGKGFSQKTNMKQHLNRHNKEKSFQCTECTSSFVTKGELNTHQRKHTGDHPFICSTCGSSFTTSTSLKKHERIHSGERPYACDFCPLRFSALGTLKNHRRTHNSEKPYQCSVCVRSFSQKSDCLVHIRKHDNDRVKSKS